MVTTERILEQETSTLQGKTSGGVLQIHIADLSCNPNPYDIRVIVDYLPNPFQEISSPITIWDPWILFDNIDL